MLTHILLMCVLATGPQVLILQDGTALKVRSYKVDGTLVRITGLKGEPLVMRSNKVDLKASQAATERLESQPDPEPRTIVERPARAPRARLSLLQASEAAIARGSQGGISVADASTKPTAEKPQAAAAETRASAPVSRPTGALPDGKDTASWQALFDGLRADYQRIGSKRNRLVRQYNAMRTVHYTSSGYAYVDHTAAAEKGALGARIDELAADITALKATFATRKEQARRAGAKPVVYRSGIH